MGRMNWAKTHMPLGLAYLSFRLDLPWTPTYSRWSGLGTRSDGLVNARPRATSTRMISSLILFLLIAACWGFLLFFWKPPIDLSSFFVLVYHTDTQ